jgi:hypothetical protein
VERKDREWETKGRRERDKGRDFQMGERETV